jgi:hypothetical protein
LGKANEQDRKLVVHYGAEDGHSLSGLALSVFAN